MSIYYVDSSAWIKRYFFEEGSLAVEEMFERSRFLACSMLGRVEVAATIARKGSAGHVGQAEYELIQQRLEQDWAGFHQMPLDTAVLAEVDRALVSGIAGSRCRPSCFGSTPAEALRGP
jgi:predicted nucleic acid-binding protein